MEGVLHKWRKEYKQDGVGGGVGGLICDGKMSAKTKGKVYKTVMRPAELYGLEAVAMTGRQEAELEVGRIEDADISVGSSKDGQDKKWAYKGDSTDGTIQWQS